MFPVPHWNDRAVGLCFAAQLVAVLGLSTWALLVADRALLSILYKPLLGVAGASMVAHGGILAMMSCWPWAAAHGAFVGAIAICTVTAIIAMHFFQTATTILPVVGAILGLNLYFVYYPKLHFAATMMKRATSVIRLHPLLLAVSFASATLAVGYTCLIVHLAAAISQALAALPIVRGAAHVLLLVAFLWTMLALRAITALATSAVFGAHYFTHGTSYEAPDPTAATLRRGLTTQLGSVALDALLRTPLSAVRGLARAVVYCDFGKRTSALFDSLANGPFVRRFNAFALPHVAIYCRPYLDAGEEALLALQQRGIQIVAKDVFLKTAVAFSCLSIVTLALVALSTIRHFARVSTALLVPDGVLGLILVGLFWTISSLTLGLVTSGMDAMFVCLAEDPAAVRASEPVLFGQLLREYSKIII